ncbi:antitoxin ChpS [Photorhabdus temperata]|uniref:AbrB/MazE/SpoVT family DNA-binding domain-containing protein n=2 Tax=Photorhabdus TaxID=29487 RepID=A0A7X5QLM2_9GAMM|nr:MULTISPECIES: AbrB/MazE/SpoVT family DNA-binding domain-containing protein [Photorhabdus]ETS33363.1 growth regulator [Photorhabdus khanii NC19]NHB96733.1 AbrB/MazE/SpoVT family DNA-binding domain-containing protein [Photorhabdus stackebrandtii]OHV53929.1 antitoxin ChpS [Photorhabdus temperata]
MSIAIKRWGNSNGVIIPAHLLKQIGATVGQELDVKVKDGTLVLIPKTRAKRYTLDELLQQCDPNAPLETEESVWGSNQTPVGREVW